MKSGVSNILDLLSKKKTKDVELVHRFRVVQKEASLKLKTLAIVKEKLASLLSLTDKKKKFSKRRQKTLKIQSEVPTPAE